MEKGPTNSGKALPPPFRQCSNENVFSFVTSSETDFVYLTDLSIQNIISSWTDWFSFYVFSVMSSNITKMDSRPTICDFSSFTVKKFVNAMGKAMWNFYVFFGRISTTTSTCTLRWSSASLASSSTSSTSSSSATEICGTLSQEWKSNLILNLTNSSAILQMQPTSA